MFDNLTLSEGPEDDFHSKRQSPTTVLFRIVLPGWSHSMNPWLKIKKSVYAGVWQSVESFYNTHHRITSLLQGREVFKTVKYDMGEKKTFQFVIAKSWL